MPDAWQVGLVVAPKRQRKHKGPTLELVGLPGRLDQAIRDSGRHAKEICEEAGFDPGQLSRLRNGKQLHGVRADGLVRLAHAAGVSPAWIITGSSWVPVTIARRDVGEDWTHLEVRPNESGTAAVVIPVRKQAPVPAIENRTKERLK